MPNSPNMAENMAAMAANPSRNLQQVKVDRPVCEALSVSTNGLAQGHMVPKVGIQPRISQFGD